MRVCMVSKHFHPYLGGLELRVLDLSKWMVENGHEVMVVTSHEEKTKSYEELAGIKVYRSHTFFSIFNALFCPGILKSLFTLDYDVIDVNLPDPINSFFALIASKIRGKPMVVTYHADIVKDRWYHLPFKLVYGIIQKMVLDSSKAIFSTSPNYANSSKVLSKYLDKVVIASSFVDAEKFNPGIDGSELRKKFVGEDESLILFVGRLIPYKGIDVLLEALKILKIDLNVKLVLVGEGILEESLKKKSRELGLEDIVIFEGKVGEGELQKYYAACDLFTLPSVNRAEAFGLVLAEAMACGKPCVTTNFSGMPYVVGKSGITVGPNNPKELALAIRKLVVDKDLNRRLGLLARERVEKLFTAKQVGKIILSEYEKSLETNI